MNNSGCNIESSTFKCGKFRTFTANDVNCINMLPVDNGSIIPFSSGIRAIFEDVFDSKFGSLIGFGTASSSIPIIDNTINITGFFSEAFTVPRDSKITSISAAFDVLGEFSNFSGTVTIRAQIFHAPKGSNFFTGTSVSVDLAPSVTGPLITNKLVFGSANTPSVPVSAGDQLLMVFYISSKINTNFFSIIVGNASAGINIV